LEIKVINRKIPKILLEGFILLIMVVFHQCESNDRFYRPNLPEKLCVIGILDVDINRTPDNKYFFPEFDVFIDTIQFISFIKSYQIEYPEEVNDSLRDFSFAISSSEGQLFAYRNDKPIVVPLKVKFHEKLELVSGHKYYLEAKEKDIPGISAEVIVPPPPSLLELISVEKEKIVLSSPSVIWTWEAHVDDTVRIVKVDTLKSVTVKISFNNIIENRQFYAIIIGGEYYFLSQIQNPFKGFLDFTIREGNSPGFFAEIPSLSVMHHPDPNEPFLATTVRAYFIDGSKIPGDKCNITLSTQFHGPYSNKFESLVVEHEAFSSIRIKLLSIPEEFYNFEKSLYTYKKIKEDPFSEPIYLDGNIKDGTGIFAICRSSEIIVNFSPWF
jgi:hypothetical protein